MSKFKEKVLSEISFAMVDDAPDLQKLYDKVAAIDEQPELDDNQQIVLKQIMTNAGTEGSLIKAIHSLYNLNLVSTDVFEKEGTGQWLRSRQALVQLTRKQEAGVLLALAQKVLEQEEA